MSVTVVMLGLLLGGCSRADVIVVDGIEIYETQWRAAREQIGPIASVELECSELQLTYTLVRRAGRAASVVIVQGCGQRMAYQRVGYQWFSNGGQAGASSGEAAAAQQHNAGHIHHQQVIQSTQR
ncbi:MAG: hypothetical protein AAF938_24675 [Myxococcota bacterium]